MMDTRVQWIQEPADAELSRKKIKCRRNSIICSIALFRCLRQDHLYLGLNLLWKENHLTFS